MDKSNLRQKFLEIRKSAHSLLTKEDAQKFLFHLEQLPEFENAKTIMLYYSVGGEAPTHKLINSLLLGGKKVCLPRTNKKDNSITPHLILSTDALEPTSFGVPEPTPDCKICQISKIDAIIVPGIAFDGKCNRIGYGKGYYDRFLAGVKIPKIGLAFDAQISSEPLPTKEYDVPVDFVVSEKRIIRRIG